VFASRNSKTTGILLPGGKRIVYSGYVGDTTLYLSGKDDLNLVLDLFDRYSCFSGMKLNKEKCSLVPFGSSLNDPPFSNCPFRQLSDDSELERLLGVPIGTKFTGESAWSKMLTSMADSI
jgi:hypothetical protein